MEQAQLDWFETWFGTPYYHLLYQNRSQQEADNFIAQLVQHLFPQKNISVLDVACGAGRHAQSLAQYGYDVTGVDISAANIMEAKKMETAKLQFFIQDMRSMGYVNHFDVVLNLFTSFGYFTGQHDNRKAAKSMATALKPGGTFTIDYLNAALALQQLKEQDTVEREGHVFHISKQVVHGKIEKCIRLTDAQGGQHQFKESVQIFSLDELAALFIQQGLHLKNVYGNYQLHAFDSATSPRMILAFSK